MRPEITDFQMYLLIIQGLWGLVMILAGFFIRDMRSTLKEIEKTSTDLNNKLLADFATKEDLRERVHGVRGALGMHSTWIHVLAQKIGVALPGQIHRNNNDGG